MNERKQTEEALRASEERLKLMLESAKDYAIFSLDEHGNITTWSEEPEGSSLFK